MPHAASQPASLRQGSLVAAGFRQSSIETSAEKLLKRSSNFLGLLLGQVMPAIERAPTHVMSPVAPDRERVVPRFQPSLRAPKREQWRFDFAPAFPIGLVDLHVDA